MSKNSKGSLKFLVTILKIIWIPLLLIVAFLVGLYIGYGFIAESSAGNIFTREAWKLFINQIRSLQ